MNSIGVIGNGFVGSAVAEGFKHYQDVKVYDKDKSRSPHSLQETVTQDFIFICLPTPMSISTGKCDLSYIESFFNEIKNIQSNSIFIIKSTVSIGTTSYLKSKYPNFHIVHSPEFLTARTAKIDFITPSRVIVGYPKNFYTNLHHVPNSVIDLFKNRFPGVNSFLMNSEESEMVKYAANCFFATKISFFNEIKLLSNKLDCNFESILEGVLSDGRIAVSHYQVPGHDEKLGFGGTCFPKDINSLINIMKNYKIKPNVLEGAWQTNLEVRPEKDWENFSSAVSKEKDFFSKENGMDQSGCGHDHL
jgi:nucleotide sugar dehydrogenase